MSNLDFVKKLLTKRAPQNPLVNETDYITNGNY